MVAGTWHTDFDLRVETNFYLKQARQVRKSLITANTQWTDLSFMAMSQWTVMPRVVVEQLTNICPQVISVGRTNSDLMAVL